MDTTALDIHNISSNIDHHFQILPATTTYTVVSTIVWGLNTIMVIGLNAVCLVVFHKTTRIEEVTKVFLMSLTSSDLLLGVCYGIPTVVTSAINTWPFGIPICYIQAFLGFLLTISGQMSLFVVNVERFIAIAFPLRHASFITVRRAQWATVFLWLFAFLMSVANAFGAHWTVFFTSVMNHCVYYSYSDKIVENVLFYLPFMIGIMFPYLVTIILYGKILSIARQHARQIAAMPTFQEGRPDGKVDTKAATTFFLVISAYSLAVVPILVVITETLEIPNYGWLFLRVLWFSVSWIDAVIYLGRNRQFRDELKRIVFNNNMN